MKGEWRETESERRARFYAEIQRLKHHEDDFHSKREWGIRQARKIERNPWYFSASRFIKDDGLMLVAIAMIVGYSLGRFFS